MSLLGHDQPVRVSLQDIGQLRSSPSSIPTRTQEYDFCLLGVGLENYAIRCNYDSGSRYPSDRCSARPSSLRYVRRKHCALAGNSATQGFIRFFAVSRHDGLVNVTSRHYTFSSRRGELYRDPLQRYDRDSGTNSTISYGYSREVFMLRRSDVNSGDEKPEDISDDTPSVNGKSEADKHYVKKGL